jgi:hypothetical protein
MIFDELSFHDATILEVKEDSETQTLDLILDFAVDWENNKFEKKVLRFKEAIVYIKIEIPFAGCPAILEIKQLNSYKHSYSFADGISVNAKHKVEIVTNAGSRWVEFEEAEFLDA